MDPSVTCKQGHRGTPYDWGLDCRECLKEHISELESEVADLQEQDKHSKEIFKLMDEDNKRLRKALEKIKGLDCWGAGGSMAAGIAEEALKE